MDFTCGDAEEKRLQVGGELATVELYNSSLDSRTRGKGGGVHVGGTS